MTVEQMLKKIDRGDITQRLVDSVVSFLWAVDYYNIRDAYSDYGTDDEITQELEYDTWDLLGSSEFEGSYLQELLEDSYEEGIADIY